MTGERVVRRLAAILAADVAGYSRLMGRDEHGTLTRLKAHRTERLEPTLARHGGRLVKLTGDGALVEFPSAVDALSAAIEFQQAMAEANRDQPEDTHIVFRIGLHLGDLIVDGDDLYGDGVNVAARLEVEAPTGGIVVSRTIHELVEGRLKATFDDLGSLALKNIERPVQAFSVNWDPADWGAPAAETIVAAPVASPPPSQEPLPLPDLPSIAVLPFQNMSGDPEQEYFADGMVEDIIVALSRFKSLFVIARNSSFTYKGKAVDIKQVGRELGVRYVLEGSVRKAASKVRITGQLIDSRTGAHLWADHFDGSLEDVFDLQDRVTTSVVGAIAPKLDLTEIERARRKPVENPDAYDCFLRGMASIHEQTQESWEQGRNLFYHAIDLDPTFATPYGMLARCYQTRQLFGWFENKGWDTLETKRVATRAFEIGQDDAVALSWAAVGLVWVCHEYDSGAVMAGQATSLNPNLAVGWQNRGSISVCCGEHEAAIEQFMRVVRFSPLDPDMNRLESMMSSAFMFQRKQDEALAWIGRALAQRTTIGNLLNGVFVNATVGNIEEARSHLASVRRLAPQLTLSSMRDDFAFRRPQDMAMWLEAFRIAGMAE
jgi:TolB-like protein/class 3 adenylate cyclase